MSERNAYTNNQQAPARNAYDAYDEQYKPYSEPRFPDNSNTTISVVEGWLIPTGTYNQQWRRPWTTEYNQANATAVHDVVARAYGDHMQAKRNNTIHAEERYMVDPQMLAGVSASFIKPAAAAETYAYNNTKHGWGEQTGRFMLTIEVKRAQQSEPTTYLLIGYTNILAFSKIGNIDPNMECTINTIFELRNVEVNNGYGFQTVQRMQTVNQVLIDPTFTGPDNADVIRLRPYEVAMSLARMNDPKTANGSVELVDTRDIQNSAPMLSNQHWTNPNDYMANVLSGLVNGRDLARQTNHSGKLDGYFAAARQLRDAVATRDPFIEAITRTGAGHVTNSFKWRDLLHIDPNAENQTTVQWRDRVQFVGSVGENMHTAGETTDWNGQDFITQTACQIANMLPSMMSDLAIRKVTIFASNLQAGFPFCSATNGVGVIPRVDVSPQCQALGVMFDQQVVQPSTFDGQVPYEFKIEADLYGELAITLKIDRYDAYTYVQPAFCSSAMSPILTSSRQTLDNLSTAFYNLQESALPSAPRQPLIHDLAAGSGSRPSGTRY